MKTIGILFFLFVSAAFVARAQEPPAKAKETFERVCGTCHKPEAALSARRSRDQWTESIEGMISRGAKISDEEFATVLDYLVRQYGKVNVNRGTVDEMVEVLGVTAQEADAIVKYRADKGKFEDFAALSKVPGVDVQKLEKNRVAIGF